MMYMYDYPMMDACSMCMYNMCCPMQYGSQSMMPNMGMYPMYPMMPTNMPMYPPYEFNMEDEMLLPNMNLMREMMDDIVEDDNLGTAEEENIPSEEKDTPVNAPVEEENSDGMNNANGDENISSNADSIKLDDESDLLRSEVKGEEKSIYCYTLANNLNCVFNELMLWTDISSEHPIFIKTVAELTKKNLPKELKNGLMEVNKIFSNLNKQVMDLRKKAASNSLPLPNIIMELNRFLKEFFKYDTYFLQLLGEIMKHGKEDKVWQTLLHHITHEQKFMYELFQNIDKQI